MHGILDHLCKKKKGKKKFVIPDGIFQPKCHLSTLFSEVVESMLCINAQGNYNRLAQIKKFLVLDRERNSKCNEDSRAIFSDGVYLSPDPHASRSKSHPMPLNSIESP